VNLWLDDPHTPWIPSEEQIGQRGAASETRSNLRKVLEEMDRQIGRLLDRIRELKLEGNTLVVFMSDNGPLPTLRQTRTARLRGSKLSLYEGGIRVPMIAWWPGKVPEGRVDEKTVISSLDLFPTFTEIGGGKLPANYAGDGANASAALFWKTIERTKPLFWEYGRNTNSFAFGRGANRSPNVAMRDGKWKLLVNADGTGAELYNLDVDSREERNVANDESARIAKMKAAALQWRKSLP
jgi:arylsulfatase A-like enzyme